MLRQACASGDVRSRRQPCNPATGIDEGPHEPVKPSDWTRGEVDLEFDADGCGYFVDVDEDDFRYWLGTPTQGKSVRGKQPRIIALLKTMFPNKPVPDPAFYSRDRLRAELLKEDDTLDPLDLATLRKAIKNYNRSIGNDAK
jgi:hypothetical protein